MATRIFELARDLDVTSKVVLDKCRAEGLDIKNHMSTVSAGLEATIREWFSEDAPATAVETAEHVDLDTAHEEARKQRRKRGRKPEPETAEAEPEEHHAGEPEEGEPAEPAVAEQEFPAEAEETERVEAPEAAEEAPAGEEAPAEVAAEVEAPASETEVEEETEAAAAEEAEVAEPAEAAVAAAETPVEEDQAAAETEGEVEEEAEREGDEEAEADEEEDEDVQPAGPQVVPKPAKLKGPRVVRVERPDYVPAPPPRSSSRSSAPVPSAGRMPRTGGTGPGGGGRGGEEKGKGKGKSKRRSPRRRGGRSADSGERLREWREKDLKERSARLAAAGGGLRRHRASVSRGRGEREPIAKGGRVEIEEPITIKALSAATGIKAGDIIKRLMQEGILATINETIDREQAEAIAADYGIELLVEEARSAEEELVEEFEAREQGELTSRAPVVTFLGHVDHGKTSLLDHIRQTSVASGEAGGITQHIGSYRYDVGDRHVVFLDTPGHEAFTAMRARGANMTDVVVLVVAADDGVMPQTVEAISHAKAAGVPIVVALNKIDLPNANVNRVMGQLAEHELQPQEWGGDTEVIQTSAETGEGIDSLLETLSLEAELLELKAEADAPATGFVIESEMDPGRGVLGRLLVRNGTLKVGDIVLAGAGYGRVRQIVDSQGREIESAGPSTPVEIAGLDEIPEAGDRFYILDDLDRAREISEERRQQTRAKELASAPGRTLQDLLSQIEAGEANELPLIVKADVQGSLEAIRGQLEKLNTDEVRVNLLHTAVGGISTGDVSLAEASGAIIIGFDVVADATARQQAEAKGVEIRSYRVIYDLIEDVRKALEEGLEPEIREETLGRAEVRQLFKVSRVGTIAGCYVTDGTVSRNARCRIIRNNVVVEDERTLESLKRFKDDVRDVRNGMECGLKIAGYDDIKEGDILEFYRQVEVSRTL